MTLIKLDIISDPICPWCYIGKTYLDRALEKFGDNPFEIEWKPYQLNLGMPLIGMDRHTYLEAKFGGQQGAVKAYLPVQEHFEKAGIKANLGNIKRTPNTINAHRLIHWAGLEGCQSLLVSALFKAYFIEGRDIGDVDELAEISEHAGMNKEMVARLFATEQDIDLIRAEDKAKRDMGVNSVPTFIVAEQYVVSGAQEVDTWTSIIEELAQKAQNIDASY